MACRVCMHDASGNHAGMSFWTVLMGMNFDKANSFGGDYRGYLTVRPETVSFESRYAETTGFSTCLYIEKCVLLSWGVSATETTVKNHLDE